MSVGIPKHAWLMDLQALGHGTCNPICLYATEVQKVHGCSYLHFQCSSHLQKPSWIRVLTTWASRRETLKQLGLVKPCLPSCFSLPFPLFLYHCLWLVGRCKISGGPKASHSCSEGTLESLLFCNTATTNGCKILIGLRIYREYRALYWMLLKQEGTLGGVVGRAMDLDWEDLGLIPWLCLGNSQGFNSTVKATL